MRSEKIVQIERRTKGKHVKGSKPYTGGCISFDEDRMVEILKNCDMSLVIKVIE